MSIPVALDALRTAVAERGPSAYVLTVSDDGRPHVVHAPVRWEGDALAVDVGRRSAANGAARPCVSLMFPVRSAGDHSLIVDGTARVDGQRLIVTPTKAVLHRSAPAPDPDASPCDADCVPLLPGTEKPARRYALQAIFGPGQDGMVSHTPHAAHLGIRVVETGPGFGVCVLPFREELIGDPRRRVIFGGAITTLIDHASGLAVACAVEELTAIATIDLRVDYLRAARPDLELYARSECYRLTSNVGFVRAVAYEERPDDPFASALGTFMIGANRSDSSFVRLVRERKAEGT